MKFHYLILILTITIDITLLAASKVGKQAAPKSGKLCIKAKCSQGGSCGCMPPPPRPQPQPQPQLNPCSLNPCLNGAICQETGYMNGYLCICPPGYMGQNCESCMLTVFRLIFII